MTPSKKSTIIVDVAKRRDLPNVVTLLTDFGWADSYVGQLKGVICSINPEVRIVDLSHSIAPGDTFGASFVLSTCYRVFPKGTIHLVVVDPGVGSHRKPLIVVSSGHLFVGPDNGVFSHICDENDVIVFEITNRKYFAQRVSNTFHGRDIFAPVAGHLSRGMDPQSLGERLREFVNIPLPQVKIDGNTLRGEVMHTDSFGNLITNISRQAVEGSEEEILIEIRGKTIEGMRRAYAAENEGSLLAIWGSSDLLEISLCKGRADQVLGARRGEPVVVRTRKSSPEKEAIL